jgi:hypothetical protein
MPLAIIPIELDKNVGSENGELTIISLMNLFLKMRCNTVLDIPG